VVLSFSVTYKMSADLETILKKSAMVCIGIKECVAYDADDNILKVFKSDKDRRAVYDCVHEHNIPCPSLENKRLDECVREKLGNIKYLVYGSYIDMGGVWRTVAYTLDSWHGNLIDTFEENKPMLDYLRHNISAHADKHVKVENRKYVFPDGSTEPFKLLQHHQMHPLVFDAYVTALVEPPQRR